MKHRFLTSSLGLAALLLAGTTAQAGVIDPLLTIGYSMNGSAPQTILSGRGIIGTGPVTAAGAQGSLAAQTAFGQLVNFDFNVDGGGSGSSPVTLFVTESGLTGAGLQSIMAELTSNTTTTPPPKSIDYKLYGSVTDQLFGGTLLGSTTVTGIASGTIFIESFDTGTADYSLTQEVTLVPSGQGTTNVSLDGNVNVPEPGSLTLLGTGLVALGLLLRRRRRA